GMQRNPRFSNSRRTVDLPDPGPPVMTNKFSTRWARWLLCGTNTLLLWNHRWRANLIQLLRFHSSRLHVHSFGDGLDDPLCVAGDADQRGGAHRVEEVQSQKIESGNFCNDPLLMDWVAILREDRQINPGKVVSVSRTPDHILDLQSPAVLEQRQ